MSKVLDKFHDLQSGKKNIELVETSMNKNPFKQFSVWIKNATEISKLPFPNAMTLSTSTKAGKPSGRIVLLKDFNEFGFVFFTNYTSKKANELKQNPFAALTFYWPGIERQVRISGHINKTSKKESEKYFKSRPTGSQLAAIASPQSMVVKGRDELELLYKNVAMKHENKQPICPSYWGGYRLIPDYFEFWQGRSNRFHDRITYTLSSGKWKIERIAP